MNTDDVCLKSWKSYQRRLKRIKRRRSLFARLPFLAICAGGCFLILLTISYSASWIYAHLNKTERGDIKEEKLETARPERFAALTNIVERT